MKRLLSIFIFLSGIASLHAQIKVKPTAVHVTCIGGNNGILFGNGTGGTSPYTYTWQPGSVVNNSITAIAPGVYTVTMRDAASNTVTTTFNVGYKVFWQNLYSEMLVHSDTLIQNRSDGRSNWNQTGYGSNTLPANTDGWIEYIPKSATMKDKIFGLLDSASGNGYSDIDYGIYLTAGGSLYAMNNSVQTSIGSYAASDIIRMERVGNTVSYKKNGTSVWSGTVTTTMLNKDWIVKAALYAYGTGMENLGCSFPSLYAKVSSSNTITCANPYTSLITKSTTAAANLVYSWYPEGSTPTSSVTNAGTAGTYSITLGNTSYGCERTYTVAAVAAPNLSLAPVVQRDYNCTTPTTGNATVSISSGSSPYVYSWDGSAYDGTATSSPTLAIGVHTLQVKDTYSCSASQTFTIQRCATWTSTVSSVTINSNGDLIKSGGSTSWTDGAVNTNTATPFVIKDTAAWVSFDIADTASSFLLGFSSVSGDTIAQPAHYKFYIENASATLIEMDNDGFYNKMEIAKVKPGSHVKIQLVKTGIEYYVSADAASAYSLVYTSKLFGTRPMILEGILNRTGSRINKVRVSGNGNM
ncbi:MAG: SprB repeat-containing protein [Bacteroidetes bacterium]|nr:SprB repeat-containing protein [Bacteroidota bacterium]